MIILARMNLAELRPMILNFIKQKVYDKHLAEDLCQEAMIKIWQNSHKYTQGKSSFSTWAHTVARNTMIDYFRKENRRIRQHNSATLEHWAQNDDEALKQAKIELELDLDYLEMIVELIPMKYKEPIKAVFFEGKKYIEYAEETGTNLNTVKSRIKRGKEEIIKLVAA